MKIIFGVQATQDDFQTTDLWRNISALDIGSGMVGRDNVFCVSNSSSRDSEPFREFIQRTGCDVIWGDEFDVNSRFNELYRHTKADVVIRIPIANFFADPQIIWAQVELLQTENLDLALLPERFDGRFGGDVSSGLFFEKFSKYFGSSFRPWADAIGHTGFKIGRIPRHVIGRWGKAREEFLFNYITDFWPERWCTAASPNETYKFFIEQIKALIPSQPDAISVLDLATGEGMGAAMLAREGFRVVGVDYDPGAIKNARKNFGGLPNLRFHVGDATTFSDQAEFDVIVSSCTMGHIEKHEEFLANVKKLLRWEGYFLNAPALKLENPIGKTFLSPHVHEYVVDELVELTEGYFSVIEVFGENRGRFGSRDTAHDFAVVVAKKKSP